MVYKIIDIDGVGDVYAEKLIAAGIKDTDAILEKCCKNNYRDQIFHSLCQKSLNLSDFSIEPTSIPFLEYGKVSIPLVTSAEMSKV